MDHSGRVTDEHVEAVRAFFKDGDEFDRRLSRLELGRRMGGFLALVAATLYELANRRFGGPDRTPAAIVRWVAEMRVRHDEEEVALNPVAAEQLLLMLLDQASTYGNLSEEVRGQTQYLLLSLLHDDLGLDDGELDELLATGKQRAERLALSQG